MSQINKINPSKLRNMKPEMTVAKNTIMQGDMRFKKLLRIEGTVEGKIVAPSEANLLLCNGGTFVGNIYGLQIAYIDGKVKGDIFVENVYIGPNAIVFGNVTCKSIQVSSTARIFGLLDVSATNDIASNASQMYENTHFVEYKELTNDS